MINSIRIHYKWWFGENQDPIPEEHKEYLSDHAEHRIAEMMQEGFTSGILNVIITDDQDLEFEYDGWWSLSRSNG